MNNVLIMVDAMLYHFLLRKLHLQNIGSTLTLVLLSALAPPSKIGDVSIFLNRSGVQLCVSSVVSARMNVLPVITVALWDATGESESFESRQ